MIDELISSPESKTLEFKRDLSSPRPLLKTLVAFANTAGGRLAVGIDDLRQVVGVTHPLDDEERLCNLISDGISPRLVPNVELITIEGKTVLVVEVFVSGSRPHWLKAEGPEQKLFSDRSHLDEQALQTLKLLTSYQGRLVPTKGAVLLFGKNRAQHFSDAWVQCGRFVGTDKAVIFDHIDIHDYLPQAVDSIMLFLKKTRHAWGRFFCNQAQGCLEHSVNTPA